jgi:hemerythrin
MIVTAPVKVYSLFEKFEWRTQVLEWSDKFLIGIPRIDFEHETFFGLVSDFEKARLSKADKKQLLGILDEIALYAKFHFRSEENVMTSLGYPGLKAHEEKHLQLVEDLSNKILGMTLGSITAEATQKFLVDWFLHHTTNEDKKIAEFQKLSSSKDSNA